MEQLVPLTDAVPVLAAQLEIRWSSPSLTYFAKPPPASVSELVCSRPSKAEHSAGGDGVKLHGGKGLLEQKGNGWAEGSLLPREDN